jgi:hypothetical protein
MNGMREAFNRYRLSSLVCCGNHKRNPGLDLFFDILRIDNEGSFSSLAPFQSHASYPFDFYNLRNVQSIMPQSQSEEALLSTTHSMTTTTTTSDTATAPQTDSSNSSSGSATKKDSGNVLQRNAGESPSGFALLIAAMVLGTSASFVFYTKRTDSMLRTMHQITKNQLRNRPPPKFGPPTKQEWDKMRPRLDDDDFF